MRSAFSPEKTSFSLLKIIGDAVNVICDGFAQDSDEVTVADIISFDLSESVVYISVLELIIFPFKNHFTLGEVPKFVPSILNEIGLLFSKSEGVRVRFAFKATLSL